MLTMENLTQMGQEARNSFIKSSHGSAVAYFKVPMQLVKIEHSAGDEGFSKASRLLVQAINGAYGAVVKALKQLQDNNPSDEERKAFAAKEFSVMAEDELAVTMTGDLRVKQIGMKAAGDNTDAMKQFFNDVKTAVNDGSVAAHKKGMELLAKHVK